MEKPREIILVAMTPEGLIGAGNALPWHLPEELQLFRGLTLGATLVMGRLTFEAIGRPLPQRRNLVISSGMPDSPGVTVCRSFEAAVSCALSTPEPVFYVGGRSVFAQALERVTALYVSWIEQPCRGDRYFPEFDRTRWVEECARQYAGFRHVQYRRVPDRG